MFQAIVTKYLPVTNTKPSRIKATCEAGSLTVSYDHELNVDENHKDAAKRLIEKLGWNDYKYYGDLVSGVLPSNAGYCHVFSKG